MNTNSIVLRATGMMLLMAGLSACISDPTYVEEDFGKSVRQMVQGQIYDPAAASNPLEEPPEAQDGETSSTSITEYREYSKRPKDKQDNVIKLGL